MKKMRNSMKLLLAMLVMVMAFAVTGITVSAAAPANVQQTSATDTSFKIQWTGVSGAKYYGVRIATDAAFKNVVKDTYTSSTSIYVYSLVPGTTYYVKVGYGDKYNTCYTNFSPAIDVVTAPSAVTSVKFVGANDTSATIQYPAAAGATSYDIKIDNVIRSTTATTYNVPIVNGGSNYAYVYACRTSSKGFKAVSSSKSVSNLSRLTTKISKENFGPTTIYSYINVIYFGANYYGKGFDIEFSGKNHSYSQTTTTNEIRIDKLQASKMYKYRVRAYIITTDGNKVYGNWSDYRYVCKPKDVKVQSSGKKIKLTWGKLTGVSKVKVMISTKEKSGYKVAATLKGKKKACTITKCGKKALKKNKTYYVRLYYQVKSGKKYVNSDVCTQGKITVR